MFSLAGVSFDQVTMTAGIWRITGLAVSPLPLQTGQSLPEKGVGPVLLYLPLEALATGS